jgi:hypothetical protein
MMAGNTASSVADADGCHAAGEPFFRAGPPAGPKTQMFFLVAWCFALGASASQVDQRDDWGPVPAVVVVRLSQAFLDPLVSADIHNRSGVHQVVLGRLARGQAETNGHVRLDLKQGDSISPVSLNMVFEGVTVARTQTRSGPAIVNTVATTQFTAIKRIELTSDRRLRNAPARISVRTSTRVSSIQSTLRGPGGCLVRRIAARRFERDRPTINAIAQRNAENRIAASFDEQVNERLESLNERLAELRITSEQKVLLSTTEKILQIAIPGPGEQWATPALPDVGMDANLVQVWIHWSVLPSADSLRSPELAEALELLDQLRKRYAVVSLDLDLGGIPTLLAIADPWMVVGLGDEDLFQESGDASQRPTSSETTPAAESP